jgi:hypothetical protein
MTSSRASVILMALRDIAQDADIDRREIELNAVEDELIRIRGGCRCEREAHGHVNRQVTARVFHGLRHDIAQIDIRQDNHSDMAGHDTTIKLAFANLT